MVAVGLVQRRCTELTLLRSVSQLTHWLSCDVSSRQSCDPFCVSLWS